MLEAYISLLRGHRGKGNAVSAKCLAGQLSTNERTVRRLAREARRSGRPICGDNSGYYWAATEAEWRAELESLRSRALDMISTCRGFKRGWQEHGKPVQARLEL